MWTREGWKHGLFDIDCKDRVDADWGCSMGVDNSYCLWCYGLLYQDVAWMAEDQRLVVAC